MLQINTGKLFTRGIGRTNRLTGVLYTNLRLPHETDIVTAAGTLRSTGSGPADLAVIFEMEERIEAGPDGPGALISHTAGPYLDDFAVIASFGLGGVVSREPAIVRALTDGRPGLSSHDAPQSFIFRFFDRTLYLTDEDVAAFQSFVTTLLGLERKSFLGAIQAMRTCVAALHRVKDNLAQAYTMMVSAVESLAQDFDGYAPVWADVDEKKRKAVDLALKAVEDDASDGVRAAILGHEHLALSRRYRHFILSHIDDGFFRAPRKAGRPMARYELEPGIRQAYNLRSAYIHQLRALPTALSLPHEYGETTEIDRKPALTFQGLYRVTAHVIRSFVERQPAVAVEPYNYSLERAGVIEIELAPQYWAGAPIADPRDARRRLEGLLAMVASVLAREPDAVLIDMGTALADVERLLPQSPAQYRPALLSLHFLFNLFLVPEQRSENFDTFYDRHAEEAGQPSHETLVLATILGAVDGWPSDTYAATLNGYFTERTRKNGLRAPRLFEAAMCLTLAEKYRTEGEIEKALQEICRAFEVHPEHQGLRALLESAMPQQIAWRSILLPGKSANDGNAASAGPEL